MFILEIIFPVFAIAAGGYLTARLKIFSPRDADGLSRFVFKVALPILLFNSLVKMELPEKIDWGFFLSYYLVAIIIYALGLLADKYFFSGSPAEQGIFGLGASYSNLILVGLPIISAGFGEAGLLPLFMIVSVHSATLFFIATFLVERGNSAGQTSRVQIFKQIAKNLARNPIIVSLMLGLTFNLANLYLPPVVDDTLTIVSKAALPCALFVLGASLNQYKIAGEVRKAWTIIGLKMILQPILVWILAFLVFRVDPLWGSVAVVAAGMPVGINTFLFAQRYRARVATLSTAILLSTLLAVFSQSILLAIFI